MLLFPYTKYTLNIYRPAAVVEAELAARVKPRTFFRSRSIFSKTPDPAVPFEGVVENGSFNINRIINYRNSFLPVVVGEIKDDLDVTKVTITMRMHTFVLFFLIAWFAIFGTTFSSVDIMGSILPIVLLGVILPFAYLIILLFFNMEANKARRFLEQTWRVDGPLA